MKFTFRGALGFRKVVLLGIFITIFSCGVGLLSYHYSSKALYERICQSYEDRVEDNAKLLSLVFKEKLREIELIAEDTDIQSMDWEVQNKRLTSYIDKLEVKRFWVYDKKGFAKATDGNEQDLSDREYFRKAISGTPNISDVLWGRVDHSLLIICAAPIRKNGNIVGVLSYAIDYQILNKLIQNIKVGQEGYAVAINNKGQTVAHPNSKIILAEKTIIQLAQTDSSLKALAALHIKVIRGQTGFGMYSLHGVEKFMAYAPIQGTCWSLELTIPQHEVFRDFDSLRNKFIIETLLMILVALLLSYFLFAYLSQRKKAENLQKNAEESYRNLVEVTELDMLKTEFFTNISHEFRTPINVILGVVQLFEFNYDNKMEYSKQDANKRIKIIKQNCLRLLRLVNNIMDAAKIDAGYMELNLKNGNIIEVVENVTLSVADYVEGRGIELIFDTDVEEKIMAFDADKIERILLNLLSNAMKFTKPGGKIFVSISDIGEKIEISVTDTGAGIPYEKQKDIFERFRQANKSLVRMQEGTGIGLSLVKSLVAMHGGGISVQSEPGKGSEFRIELPAAVIPTQTEVNEMTKEGDHQKFIEKIHVEFSDIYF